MIGVAKLDTCQLDTLSKSQLQISELIDHGLERTPRPVETCPVVADDIPLLGSLLCSSVALSLLTMFWDKIFNSIFLKLFFFFFFNRDCKEL